MTQSIRPSAQEGVIHSSIRLDRVSRAPSVKRISRNRVLIAAVLAGVLGMVGYFGLKGESDAVAESVDAVAEPVSRLNTIEPKISIKSDEKVGPVEHKPLVVSGQQPKPSIQTKNTKPKPDWRELDDERRFSAALLVGLPREEMLKAVDANGFREVEGYSEALDSFQGLLGALGRGEVTEIENAAKAYMDSMDALKTPKAKDSKMKFYFKLTEDAEVKIVDTVLFQAYLYANCLAGNLCKIEDSGK